MRLAPNSAVWTCRMEASRSASPAYEARRYMPLGVHTTSIAHAPARCSPSTSAIALRTQHPRQNMPCCCTWYTHSTRMVREVGGARGSGLADGGCAMPSEADTCRQYVVPKLYAAGWTDDQIAEQRTFTAGGRPKGRGGGGGGNRRGG